MTNFGPDAVNPKVLQPSMCCVISVHVFLQESVRDISGPQRHNRKLYRLFDLPLCCAERLLSAARLRAAVSSSDVIGVCGTQRVC